MPDKLTHWKKLNNPDYIGAYAFEPNETKTLTIQKVTREIVKGPDGKSEECTIVHWRENEKPLILNVTNAKAIQKIAGTPYIEKWPNVCVMLGVETVKAFGEIVEAVRVKKTKPPQPQRAAKQELTCADCGKIITPAGGFSAEVIAKNTSDKFGTALCFACGTARKAKPAEAPEAPAETKEEEALNENNQNQDQ